MSWVTFLGLLLQLAAFVAKRAERKDIEEAVLNEIQILHGKRVRAAASARDDVMSGRVPIDPADPYLRDD